MMEAAPAIPDEWILGCRALREALAGRLDRATTVGARQVVWSLLQRLRRAHTLPELEVEYQHAGWWSSVVRPVCIDDAALRQIVLAAFAARLMELLRGCDLEALEELPRPLLSEFIVNEIL